MRVHWDVVQFKSKIQQHIKIYFRDNIHSVPIGAVEDGETTSDIVDNVDGIEKGIFTLKSVPRSLLPPT